MTKVVNKIMAGKQNKATSKKVLSFFLIMAKIPVALLELGSKLPDDSHHRH
jgi:hypothetical protein